MATRTLAAMVVTSVVGAESDTLPPLLAILVGVTPTIPAVTAWAMLTMSGWNPDSESRKLMERRNNHGQHHGLPPLADPLTPLSRQS